MAVGNYGTVSVTTSAKLIVAANEKRKAISIVNSSNGDLFIGPDSSITTANAIPLYGYTTRDSNKTPEGWLGPIYGITASGTVDVRYWETVL